MGSEVTNLQCETMVERMFPDWREHLSDGKVMDHVTTNPNCTPRTLQLAVKVLF